MIGDTEIKAVNRLTDLNIVVHTCGECEMLTSRQTVIDGEYGTNIIYHAGFRVVEEPMQLRGEFVFEPTVGHLIGDLETVAPIHPWIDAIIAHLLIAEGRHQSSTVRKLITTPSLRIGNIEAQPKTVFIKVSVVVPSDDPARKAHVHSVMKEWIFKGHGIQPSVELGTVMVEAQFLLYLKDEFTRQVSIEFGTQDGPEIATPLTLSKCWPSHNEQQDEEDRKKPRSPFSVFRFPIPVFHF